MYDAPLFASKQTSARIDFLRQGGRLVGKKGSHNVKFYAEKRTKIRVYKWTSGQDNECTSRQIHSFTCPLKSHLLTRLLVNCQSTRLLANQPFSCQLVNSSTRQLIINRSTRQLISLPTCQLVKPICLRFVLHSSSNLSTKRLYLIK